MTPAQRIAKLAKRLAPDARSGNEADERLAAVIGVSPRTVYNWRQGRQPMRSHMRLIEIAEREAKP